MIITRYAYTRATEKYQVEINQEFVNAFNQSARRCYELNDWVDLTVEELCEIYKNPDCELAQRSVKSNTTNGWSTYEFIEDYINSMLWDSYIETVSSETEDYEDYEDYEDEVDR